MKASVQDKKLYKAHWKVLQGHLRQFFKLLDSKPKPTAEVVRNEFLRHEADWRLYCARHDLGIRTSEMFNAQVSYQWERKYAIDRPTQ